MDEGVAVQQRRLDGGLARQTQGPFEVPDAMGVVEGAQGVAGGQLPAELVDEEEPRDEQELTYETRTRGGVRVRFCLGRLGERSHPRPLR